MSTLRAESIEKRFKQRQVVKGISLCVNSGEIVGLLGPNGAGKTTAFYMIVGLIPCDRGHITLDKHDLTGMPMHRRARLGLGYLPQEASVFRRLSVENNILAILETRPGLDRATRAVARGTAGGTAHRPCSQQHGYQFVRRRAPSGRNRTCTRSGTPLCAAG